MHNTLKTTILLAALTALLVLIGGALGGRSGMVLFFGIAVVMNLGAYWFSGDIALRSFTGHRLFALAAPTGGTILIIAWFALAVAAIVALVRG